MESERKSNLDTLLANCPRCGSCNTKFCYYNNYSLRQPRYFCKSCRRYWTKGGSLRNVPVGGGCRRSRRGNNNPLRTSSHHVPSAGHHAHPSAAPSTIPSSTAAHDGGSDVDLAQVYASFLNRQPEPEPPLRNPEFPAGVHPSGGGGIYHCGSDLILPDEQETIRGFTSGEMMIGNYGLLPPFPGVEEVVAPPPPDMGWASSELMGVQNHIIDMPPQPSGAGIEPEVHQHLEYLIGNEISFDALIGHGTLFGT